MTDRGAARRTGRQVGLTALLGVIAVPVAAVAAVALLRGPGPVENAADATSTPPTIVEAAAPVTEFVVEPVTSSEDDLVAACTTDGLVLVERERTETITELQTAALAALRGLCEEAEMPLPGPPAPPPVVRTVKVAKPTGPRGSGGGGGSGEGSEPTDASAAYAAAHAAAKSAIATAERRDPESEDLREAREKLSEAEHIAAGGNYREAIAKAQEAEREAREAVDDDD